MRAVIQRVKKASVKTNNNIKGQIQQGLLIYLAIEENDTEAIAKKLVKKIINIRIFEDSNGKMNNSLLYHSFEVLLISQFTLYADCKKGNRPFFGNVAKPDYAHHIYNIFKDEIKKQIHCESGEFAAMMQVESINDGPVTLIIDTNEI